MLQLDRTRVILKLSSVVLAAALLLGPVGAEPSQDTWLDHQQPTRILAEAECGLLERSDALLQLNLYNFHPGLILQPLKDQPETSELLLVRGRCRPASPQGRADLERCYALAQGVTRFRAAATLARLEAKQGHLDQAMRLLAEAQHGARSIDQSWLNFEVAESASQIHSLATPNEPDWGGLLLLRQRCRERQEWFWAARCGMAIFEQLRLQPDGERALEYAVEAFEDAERHGDRIYLWSAVQEFATGATAVRDQAAAALKQKARSGTHPFAYLAGLHWFEFEAAENYERALASAETDREVYEARRDRLRFKLNREDLEWVHQYERDHRADPSFRSCGDHLEECAYFQRLAELEKDPLARANLLWKAWDESEIQSIYFRYNLLQTIRDDFRRSGLLQEVFRAQSLQYQKISQHPQPLDTLLRLFPSRASGVSLLTSWEPLFGQLVRAEMAGPLVDYEQELLDRLDEKDDARGTASKYSRLADYYRFRERDHEALEAAREQVAALPGEAFPHRDLAGHLADLGCHAEAIEQLDRALELEQKAHGLQSDLYFCMQAESLGRLGRFSEAEERLRKSQALVEKASWGQERVDAQRSTLLGRQKRWPELLELLKRRATLAPPLDRFLLLLNLAEVQLELHQFQEASASWAQAELLADSLGGGAPARLFLACASHLEPTQRRALLEKARKRLLELAPLLPEKGRPYFFQQSAVCAVLQDQPLSPDPPAAS